MGIVSDIKKLKSDDIGLTIFAILMGVAPGYLCIFYFERALFLQLDFFKLLILSISLISPLLIVNTLIFENMAEKSGAGNKDRLLIAMAASSILSGLIFYIGLLVSYFGDSDIIQFIKAVLGLEIVSIIFLIILYKNVK